MVNLTRTGFRTVSLAGYPTLSVTLIFVAMVFIFVAACGESGEDGDFRVLRGTSGQQGPQGQPGLAGQAGPRASQTGLALRTLLS